VTTRLDRLLFRLCDRLPCRIIADAAGVYLERYYLGRMFGWTFYLHRFVAPDPGEALHDHPWPFALSLVLTGGYKEWRGDLASVAAAKVHARWLRPGRINLIRGGDFHRVAAVAPGGAFTLFAHRPHRLAWGFLAAVEARRPGGKVDVASYEPASARHGASFGAPWWKTAPKGRDEARRLPLEIAR